MTTFPPWRRLLACSNRSARLRSRRLHLLGAACLGAVLGLAAGPAVHAQFLITEFMAVNNTSLNDEDGNNSDWIEIHNESTAAASLEGWYLTDSTNDLVRWQFPATNLPPNGYLVVFASGKDRRTPGAPLHTNFRLSGAGDYLALVKPNGTNVVSAFAPAFPPQVADVSYGIVRDSSPVSLLAPGAPARALVPADGNLGLDWTAFEFDEASWAAGATGVGYDRQTIGVNFLPYIGLNVETAMYNVNQTLYVRVPFEVANPDELAGLTLRMRFEDGFIAYLNGVEVASSNAPANPTWNSGALGPRTDLAATNAVDFDVTEFRGFLVAGQNVLAFQALNNPVASPDLLLLPELIGLTLNGPPLDRYFTEPTPGGPNEGGIESLGPIIRDPAFTPLHPGDGDDLHVTARLQATLAPTAAVALHYRVLYGPEVEVPMYDDGAHGDGAAGDGVFGGAIPQGASMPGQMVRWFLSATDATGTNTSRYPALSRPDGPEYLGTVVTDPQLATNRLPVFHWFVQNTAATDTTAGTRCSVFYEGEFYDNLFCRVRGASAPTFPKKPYKFDFNPAYHFRFLPGQPRVDEINLNTTYQDKAYVRAPLTFETYREAGVPACDAFTVRVQQNGAFYSVAFLTEQVDETFLERRHLDPKGALYKMYNGITSATSGVEKKTRRQEDNQDLQALVNAVASSNPNRGAALFDLLDVPEMINYLAAGTVAQDWDRAIKNIYLYRDSEGDGLWRISPWDKDLSFGKAALVSDVVVANKDDGPKAGNSENDISHPFYGTPEYNCCGANNLIDALYKTPATREMYLRRLRTLMDAMLQPPGTAPGALRYEARLDALASLLRDDAALDLARWGAGYGQLQDLDTAIGFIKTDYLAPRRVHLYQTHGIDNVGLYPGAVGVPHAQVGSPALEFGQIEFNPASSNQAEEFVELLNPNPVAVDVSGWSMSGGVSFKFTPGTVIPAQGRIYVSPDVRAFRARAAGPRGGQGLFVVGNYSGQLSARGEALSLRDAHGSEVASIRYEPDPSPAQQFLRVTEIMYHPSPAPGLTNSPEDFEFIELKNISADLTLDLRGVRLSGGVEFDFTDGAVTELPPGERVVVARRSDAFTARYGAGLPLAGAYTGTLDNGGERLRLLDASGEEILDFSYDNQWYPVTDGHGFSLAVVDETADPDLWNSASNWRPGGQLNGSPGAIDPSPPALPAVLITEVLSRTDVPPPTDSVELFNPTAQTADVGGWFLSDDFASPKKYRIADGTQIAPGGFLVLDESQFNSGGTGFAFSSLGDEAWLFSGDAQTNLTGYAHGFHFGAAEDGVSFGRYLNSLGAEQFVAQKVTTLGATNAGPRVGPVVVSEIMYHPPAPPADTNPDPLSILLGNSGVVSGVIDPENTLEYLELQNVSASFVTLYDPAHDTNRWRLRGAVDFDFPPNQTLAPGERALLVGFDPALDANALLQFRSVYGLDNGIRILGPWQGKLDNAEGRIELQKPDAPNGGTVPRILVDAVDYLDSAPWPVAADGSGSALERRVLTAYGNDPTNWFAAGRSPGAPNVFNLAPTVFLESPTNQAVFGQGSPILLSARAQDPDGTVTSVAFFSDGVLLGELLDPPFDFVWSNASFGIHLLTARAGDDRLALTVSDPVTVTVEARPPTVSWISPAPGTLLLAGAPIALTAAAADEDGFIASVEFFDGPVKLGETATAPYVLTWSNAVPGLHQLSAAATDNSGNRVFSTGIEVTVAAGFALDQTLVATGSVWNYFDLGLNLGSAWRQPDFNDQSWAAGPAPLGYGDGDEATVVGYGPNSANKYITTYFRREFQATDVAAYTALNVRILRDDGAVVYLNGTEVFRTAMAEGPVAYDTLANVTAVGADESTTFYPAAIDPALLVEGSNLIAVEIHQVLPTSSDISFDLELAGTQTFFAPVIVSQPESQAKPAGSNAVFQVAATGTPPLHYQWRWNGTDLEGASGAVLNLNSLRTDQGGVYTVQVTNRAGKALSADALLAVTVPGDYAETILADLPIHYYRFEESNSSQPAADLGQPGGFDGVYTGGVLLNQSTAPLPLGSAIRLDGNPGTYVDLGLFHPGNSMTVEAWAWLDPQARAGSYHALVARWDGSYELDIATDDRANLVVRNQANTFGLVASPQPLTRGQWYHLAGIYDNGTMQLYVNGALAASVPLAGTLQDGGPTPDRVLIGGTRDGSSSSFNWKGWIDEVAIYNHALASDRLLAHYQAGLPEARLVLDAFGQLSWPAVPSDLLLQHASSLAPNAVWQTDNTPRVLENGYFKAMVVAPAESQRFYRLSKP
jgi:CotH kinase protein/Concanavalin A-like lectin/glucanases superfamily/Lamin Tail Domain/Bacterial Ig domain/Immunoglobulin domain